MSAPSPPVASLEKPRSALCQPEWGQYVWRLEQAKRAAEVELRKLQGANDDYAGFGETLEQLQRQVRELHEGWARTIKEWSEAEAGPMTMEEARSEVGKILAADRLAASSEEPGA